MNRRTTAVALVMGLSASVDATSSAAPPVTPPFAPGKAPSLVTQSRAPAFKIKNAAAVPFLAPVELERLAVSAALAQKKVIKPSPAGPPPINASFTQQPEGVSLDIYSPWWIHFADNQPPSAISFHANTVPTFDPNKGHAGVQFRALAGNLYVVECPITGGPAPMYRQTTYPGGVGARVVESKGAGPVT